MEQVKNKKKGIIIAGISAIVLIAVLGVTFAIWNYSRTTDNQILVTGDVYMKFKENPALTIENALPSEGPGENYFEFKIEGKNTYSKPIWYEIDLQHGEDDETRKTRIKDNLLKFRLVEIKDGDEQTVIDNASYRDLTNQIIWVNTIEANTKTKVEITYRLYMWISSSAVIGNTDDAIYDMETWNDVFASIKVNVSGDFNEKELPKPSATDIVKDTLGQTGGVIGVTSENKPTKTESENIREYRYSGTNVNNYIYFNCEADATEEDANSKCELWRIIGVFTDSKGEHLKIVRDNVLTADMFPETYTVDGREYHIKYKSGGGSAMSSPNKEYSVKKLITPSNRKNQIKPIVAGPTSGVYAYWNYPTDENYNNDWATAGLQYWLNTASDDNSRNQGYLSTLKGNTLSMIEDTEYYLGTVTADLVNYNGIMDTPKEAYVNERDIKSCVANTGKSESESGCKVWEGNKATWTGKIALLYPSDYGFSTESNYWDRKMYYTSFDEGPADTSWLQTTANHSTYEWLLSPSSDGSSDVAYWSNDGDVYISSVSYLRAVRPSLNLKSNTNITGGDGSKLKPYFVNSGQ